MDSELLVVLLGLFWLAMLLFISRWFPFPLEVFVNESFGDDFCWSSEGGEDDMVVEMDDDLDDWPEY